jgi:predicted ester cyclase
MTAATTNDASTQNADALRRILAEAFGQGNVEILDEVMAPEIVEHQPGLPNTREGLKAVIGQLRRWFPDFTMTVEDMTVDGDKVWARATARGTHLGEMMGHPPTGKRMEITVLDIARFAGGIMVEHWGVPDRFAQLEQLGLLPQPSAAR